MSRSSCAEYSDRYRLLSVAGRGTCSTVYRAESLTTGRISALKVFDDPEIFRRESEVITRLDGCPNIPRLYETGDIWYSMQFLNRFRFKGCVDEKTAVDIGISVCGALDGLHEAGYVHGDISPRNIMFDDVGTAYLCDFSHSVKIGGESLGTNAFSAPEVKNGRAVSARSDVYSLGMLLYRLIEGAFPFVRDAVPLFGEEEKALNMIASGVPVPRPAKCSGPLADIIIKALAYDPDDRYKTINDFRTDLQYLREV